MTFVLACFQASAAPRLETPDSKEKDALFGLDTIFFLLKNPSHICRPFLVSATVTN
jgi:hypothetical protein